MEQNLEALQTQEKGKTMQKGAKEYGADHVTTDD